LHRAGTYPSATENSQYRKRKNAFCHWQFFRTGEAEEFLGKEVFKVVKTHNRQTLSALKKQLKQLDDKISELLRSNEDLKKKQELLKTIPGIAEVGSLYLLLATKGFTRFKNWRKFACYCGIAPFEYSSGSSIRGRNRVNPLADKKMKSLLHLLALLPYDTILN
jgi:transposase